MTISKIHCDILSSPVLREQNDAAELFFSAQSKYRKEGNSSMVRLMQEALKSPGRPARIFRGYSIQEQQFYRPQRPFTADEAVALSIDCKTTKHQNQTQG